jgi:hypothetical protein
VNELAGDQDVAMASVATPAYWHLTAHRG